MKNQFESLGCFVKTAPGGVSALEKFHSGEFDLIMTDLDMPIMNGYELVTEIRKINPDIPVIAVTASLYDVTSEQLQNNGFNDYMLKPFDEEALIMKLNRNKT